MDLFNRSVHVDDKGIMDGLRRRDVKCSGPEAKNDDSWISIWEELQEFSLRRHIGGSRASQSASLQERETTNDTV